MTRRSERDLFTTQVLLPIGRAGLRTPDLVTAFLAMRGRQYTGDLMVVGRALNGWTASRAPAELATAEGASAYAREVLASVSGNGSCPMAWVTEHARAEEGKYNTNRSAFWRVIRRVAERLEIGRDQPGSWPSRLVWSNLYKVAPADGGNPSGPLLKLQQPGCMELLRLELETHRPARVLFLTGRGWAAPFLKALGASATQTDGMKYVEAAGDVHLPEGHRVRYVVAAHPQGKQESLWVDEAERALGG